ncbi:hypothetical protein PoB_006527800 [Plakobranchus ocellatus]|uniref:Uncharacterized protein n=1 Tax=Plakobranchus ocellatus TaxID=259542 RepID=A0AAV4D3L4_9GAST|nr:hypothetical protein PoB_006527800 [Plakobranchus ocellatus]
MTSSASTTLICLLVGVAVFSSSVSAKDDPDEFQAAVDAVSSRCQPAVAKCSQRSQKVKELYDSNRLCDLMALNDGQTSTKSCMTTIPVTKKGYCTTAEYNKVKDSVCGATSLVVSLTIVTIGVITSMLGKYGL